MQSTERLPVFRKAVYVMLLLIAVALIYGQFLWNPIVFDDLQFFMVGNDALAHYSGFSPFEIRWLPMATIAWTLHTLGRSLIWYRLEGLLLHAATGIALFFFLEKLFGLVLQKGADCAREFPHVWMAFFGALFFVWHPVAVYGAAYLIQRTIVMATLFSLLALYVYMRGLTEERPRWLWGSVILYYLAVFSKEHAVMLPAVMMVLTLLLATPSRALLRRLLPIYVACTLIALYVALQKLGLLGAVYEVSAAGMLEKIEVTNPYPLSVLTQSFLFFKYWLLWLVPDPAWMSVDMREPFAENLFSPYLWALLAFLVYGVLGFKLLLKRGETGLLGFAMLFPWLMFATEFATVRIQESFVLYRSYLWMVCLFSALPFVLRRLRGSSAVIGMLVFAIMLGMLTVNRLTIFSDPLLLWDDALTLVKDRPDLPGVARIYLNRGKHLTDIKRYKDALADYQSAVKLTPNFYYYRYALAAGYMNMARYPEAIVEFTKALEMNPKMMQSYYGRGLAELEVSDKKAALADFEKGCSLGWQSACKKIKEIASVLGKTEDSVASTLKRMKKKLKATIEQYW